MTTQSSRPLVAIVDDDESVRVATASLLRSMGYGIESITSAEEFLVAERLEEIHCLILDVKLEGMDGMALQHRLAAANLPIPIIFVTAHWNEAKRSRALRLGAVEFLPKPCSDTALLDAIDLALRVSRWSETAISHETIQQQRTLVGRKANT